MTKHAIFVAVALMLATGCASGKGSLSAVSASQEAALVDSSASPITQVDYKEPTTPELIQPPSIAATRDGTVELDTPQPLPPTDGLTVEVLEQMAFGNSPAVSQAAARVRALRGKWVQVGLAPNPTIGFVGGEIGNEGAAGQYGGLIGQDFITAQKLQRNRAIVSAEISRAVQQLTATQTRVRTDVRQSYYVALLAQRRVELADELVRLTTEAVGASQSLYDAEEIPLAGLLQTEVQQQNAKVLQRTTQNGLAQAWRRLTVIVGGSELQIQPLVGDVGQIPELLDWDEQLIRLQSQSPEVASAMANVERARRALSRASVEAVPNINAQLRAVYDDSTNDTFATVLLRLPLPLWNRNQGGIRQAQAEITQAVRNVERVELDLNQRLANAFRQYSDAHVTATTYAADILPRAKRTFDLVQQGYAQGEVGYLDLLTAQRTFSQTNLAYLDALGLLWQSYVQIDGLLLDGSLAQQPN